MSNTKEDFIQKQNADMSLQAHKYAVHFDILPEITYLNQKLPIIIADLLQLFHGFPDNLWISQQSVDEGLDFCRVIFWVFSESSDSLKTFGIWFQAIFRETQITDTLENLVTCSLEEPDAIEVALTDWTRLNTLAADVQKAIQTEIEKGM